MIITFVIMLISNHYYGKWKMKLGRLQGVKDGHMAVINALAQHFPPPINYQAEDKMIFGTKMFGVWMFESNGVRTLKIKNEM